ncbi:response regulator [Pedobacter sp.]|uniref:response regulator n=1 Tax=Pedobacter sp. TaxID=1411316 RepID=UPI003D7FF314
MSKVLLIDDDVDMLEVMESTLTFYGYNVQTSSYTDNIVALVHLHQPDLVIIDYLMPGINGGEMCAELKRTEVTKDLPVIIVSAYERIIQSLGNYGCDAFVSKPFDMKHLLAVIQKTISTTPARFYFQQHKFTDQHLQK